MKMNEINQRFIETPSRTFGMRTRKGLFGIEIELEGNLPNEAPPGWDIHREGSVRGLEYVTNGPVSYQDVIPTIEKLRAHLVDNHGYRFNRHYRASTHVHLNVATEPFINIFGMQIIFAMVEGVMLRMVGPERDGNHFCISNLDCGDWANVITRNIRYVSSGSAHGWLMRGKYAALNTDPIREQGSIEFRFFPTSLDPQEIHKWVTWLMNIRSMAKDNQDKSYSDIFQRACEQPLEFARSIIPELDFNMFPVTRIEEAVAFGTENAYEAIRVLEKELARKKKEEKKETIIPDEGVLNLDAQIDLEVGPDWGDRAPAQIDVQMPPAFANVLRRRAR
jgi:hypothetical protein